MGAVSFVKPSGFVDGHPASSKPNLFEGFVKKIVDLVQDNQKLWADTAIFITFDEGGGWDSGYVQALDYFGDDTRISTIVVSPTASAGTSPTPTAATSRFSSLPKRTGSCLRSTQRSRDNLPNPIGELSNPYVPVNSPAIGVWRRSRRPCRHAAECPGRYARPELCGLRTDRTEKAATACAR
jgi:phospholipase C